MANQNERIDSSREQSIVKLKELISGIRVAMMTTINGDGTLHSRPMWTQKIEFDGDLWFFTNASSPKSLELQSDSHVTLCYADPDDNRYVSVYGRGQMVHDREKAEQLWSEAYRAWFPEGLDDPGLALIRVPVERAEYWDSPSSKVVHLLGFIKAGLTGKSYRPGPEEHGELSVG
jgi:general stress protein 26